jgi:hypothetical protein
MRFFTIQCPEPKPVLDNRIQIKSPDPDPSGPRSGSVALRVIYECTVQLQYNLPRLIISLLRSVQRNQYNLGRVLCDNITPKA